MSESGPIPISTPKRKRNEFENGSIDPPLIHTSPSVASKIGLPPSSPGDDGNISPRTKVAHRFRSLAIGRPRKSTDSTTTGGTDAVTKDSTATILRAAKQVSQGTDAMLEDIDDTDTSIRKRLKLPQHRAAQSPADVETDGALLVEKPRRKLGATFAVERLPTPPLKPRTTSPAAEPENATPPPQIDPEFKWPPGALPDTSLVTQTEAITVAFRASMTWHEDEITVYDPDDSDDDGTGINGIGFKPTPAVAYARGIKRKQQLAEYRKREEREARARRSQRRRGSPRPMRDDKAENAAKMGEKKEKEKEKEKQRRRVRFLEASVLMPTAV